MGSREGLIAMRSKIYDNFFLLLLVFGFYGILKLLSPFAGALLGALVCAVTFYPMYEAFRRRFPHHSREFHAAMADGLVMLFFVGPLMLLMWLLYLESSSLIEAIRRGTAALAQLRSGALMGSDGCMHGAERFLMRVFNVSHQSFRDYVVNQVNQALEYVTAVGSAMLKYGMLFCLDLVVMLFALFFMFRDGEKLSRYCMDLIPLRRINKDALAVRIHETVIAVIRGWLLTAVVQGLVAMLGYWIIGAHAVVLLGTLTAALGLLPAIGTLGVSIPVALYYFSMKDYLRGGFLLVWGIVIVVGMVDSLLRPYLIGKRADLPLFILFFALLGGIEIWGAKGMILGPLLAAVMPLLVEIYRERYLRQTGTPNASINRTETTDATILD